MYLKKASLTLAIACCLNASSVNAASIVNVKEWHSFVSEMSMDLYFYQYCNMEKAKDSYMLLAMYVNLSNVSKKEIKKAKSQIKSNLIVAEQGIKSGLKPTCDKLEPAISADIKKIGQDSKTPDFMQKRPLRKSDLEL